MARPIGSSAAPDGVTRRCLTCGYPLDHLPEPRCPECGRPFDATHRHAPPSRARSFVGESMHWLMVAGGVAAVPAGYFWDYVAPGVGRDVGFRIAWTFESLGVLLLLTVIGLTQRASKPRCAARLGTEPARLTALIALAVFSPLLFGTAFASFLYLAGFGPC